MIATAYPNAGANYELMKPDERKKLPDTLLVISFALLFVVLYGIRGLPLVDSFVYTYTLFTIFRFINNLGYTINILDFLTFYSALDTLLSPLLAYKMFDKSFHLAALWGAYMRVPEETYFSYLIPANLALFCGLNLVFYKNAQLAWSFMEKAKKYVSGKLKVGIVFIVLGLIAGQFNTVTPTALAYVLYIISMLPYVGAFYIYFSVKKNRGLIMTLLVLVFFAQAARTGLFGEFVMFVTLAGCIITPQYRLRFLTKLLIFGAAFLIIMLIQSAKTEYRNVTWNGQEIIRPEYEGKGNLEIFYGIVSEKLNNKEDLISQPALFYLNRRFNQGWLISLAMNHVPSVEPYANGETILVSIGGVLVPRFLWPDKPEAGGGYNLRRFVGIKKKLKYSMNIGPFGEGYGNFGTVGGVIFIFLYAVLIAYFLHKVLEMSKKYPSLLIWIPLLFYYMLTMETDIFTTINSFVKVVVFIYFTYWLCRKAFKINI